MHRQPVPHAWACCSEAAVTEVVVGPWDDARPGGGRTQLTAIAVGSELDVVGDVWWSLASQRLIYQACDLVLNTLTNRQPVQLTQNGRDVVASSGSGDQTRRGILDGLDLPQSLSMMMMMMSSCNAS